MPREVLDLSGIPCPANSAMALLRMESMAPAEELDIIVDGGEPALNLPESLAREGYIILDKRPKGRQWLITAKRA